MSDSPQLYCTFQLDGRWFGVPVLDVKEVTTEIRFTPVPHTPSEVHGLVNIRGHIFLALNLASLLSINHHAMRPDSQLILFKPSVGHSFGIVVDLVGDIVALTEDQIEPFSSEDRFQLDPNDRGSLVAKIGKIEDRLLIIIDSRKLLPCIERTLQAMLDPLAGTTP